MTGFQCGTCMGLGEWDVGPINCGDPAPVDPEYHQVICPDCGGDGELGAVCRQHCTICEGADHHWIPDIDEDSGEPVMVCKHCSAWREMADDEDLA